MADELPAAPTLGMLGVHNACHPDEGGILALAYVRTNERDGLPPAPPSVEGESHRVQDDTAPDQHLQQGMLG
jgi:hypothetical protein